MPRTDQPLTGVGHTINNILRSKGITQIEAMKISGLSKGSLQRILAGNRVSFDRVCILLHAVDASDHEVLAVWDEARLEAQNIIDAQRRLAYAEKSA